MFKAFLLSTWEFIKPGLLPILVIFSLAITGAFIFQSSNNSVIDQLHEQAAKFEKYHQEELKKINEASEAERLAREENFRQLQSSLAEIQKRHKEQLRELERRRADKVRQLVEKFNADPKAAAEEIGRITGSKVTAAEEE